MAHFHRPTLVLAGLTALLALAALLIPLPFATPDPASRRFDLDARTFAFEPARLRVNRGDTVTLVLRSQDVVHGLYLDGYGLSIQAEPGKPAEATFVADRTGKFRFRCSVSCGSLHPFMIGELVVGPNLVFARAIAALLVVFTGTLATLSYAARRRGSEEARR